MNKELELAKAKKILDDFENEGIIKSSPEENEDYYSKLALSQIDTQIDDLENIIILSQDKLEALKQQRLKYD